MAAAALTLNDLEGLSLIACLFQCNLSNICTAFYTILTESVLARFLCISRASRCYTFYAVITRGLTFNLKIQVTWLPSPRSEAQAHVCLPVRGTPWWVLLQQSIMLPLFLLWSVVSRAFSALCVYSKFRHHPHPLGYLCAKFRFCRGLHCWASPWRKIAYSITHSPSLFDAPRTETLTFRNKIIGHCNDAVRGEWWLYYYQKDLVFSENDFQAKRSLVFCVINPAVWRTEGNGLV